MNIAVQDHLKLVVIYIPYSLNHYLKHWHVGQPMTKHLGQPYKCHRNLLPLGCYVTFGNHTLYYTNGNKIPYLT